MSAGEFGNWLAFFEEEPFGHGPTLTMWSELMAALHNGPLTKKSKALWQAAEFARPLWRPREPAQAKRPTTGADVRAHVRSLGRLR